MARAGRTDGDDDDAEAGGGPLTSVPDARLTDLLRAETAQAYPALRELRARHRPAVLAYARLCTVSEDAARQLTAQAFALAARDTARGIDPPGPWRHQLLLLSGRVAATWTADERGGRLEAGLLSLLHRCGSAGLPPAPMLEAFQSLPPRVQALIWYGVVEEVPDDVVAPLLGVTPQDVAYGKQPAFQALRQTCLKSRLARSGNPRCQDFRRLIEEAVHPENPRYSPDLHAHMTHCEHCAAAHEELTALRDTPRTALAEGLLPWGGAAYVPGGFAETRTAQVRAAGRTRRAARSGWAWLPTRRLVLVSVALGVALAPLVLFLVSSDGSQPQRTAGTVRTPQAPPAVTVTATVSVTPSPSRASKSPKPTHRSKPSKKPSATPTKARPEPKPKPSPTRTAAHPPDGTYAQVVNADSGLCLDIRDGDMELGTDVITARCSSSRTQMWRVDSGRGVLQSYADPDFCLDSRGSTDRGVGIWECRSVYGGNGMNLRFTVDGDGVIRPAIAPDHAVTPYGYGLMLTWDQGRDDQRWRAGSTAD
ncbi:ricin-type beta-trefoil lectin domain protein [Streptomyces sp. SAS_270]|uniref:ricin-type beta-trefoil lectin domain protein n=1 Tax=Streptomyces sp. SAS_270 TaxID=3412748 RepID=UPI00403D2419